MRGRKMEPRTAEMHSLISTMQPGSALVIPLPADRTSRNHLIGVARNVAWKLFGTGRYVTEKQGDELRIERFRDPAPALPGPPVSAEAEEQTTG